MADISAFIQALQQNLIDPLKNMPEAQLKALDTTHDQSVSNFQKAIGRLYEPSVQFEGKTSEALADLLSQYYSAENKLTPYMSDGLSDHISKLIQFCHQVVNDLEPKLKDLKGTDPLELGGQVLATEETGATLGGDETPAVPLVQLICVLVAGTAVMVGQGIQEWKMWDAYDTAHHWEMNMSGLAAQAESTLPASPNFSVDVILDLAARDGLTPAQQQEVADIIAQLTAEGYPVDQWEVEALIQAGYDKRTILGILRTINDRRTNFYLKGKPYTNDLVDLMAAIFS